MYCVTLSLRRNLPCSKSFIRDEVVAMTLVSDARSKTVSASWPRRAGPGALAVGFAVDHLAVVADEQDGARKPALRDGRRDGLIDRRQRRRRSARTEWRPRARRSRIASYRLMVPQWSLFGSFRAVHGMIRPAGYWIGHRLRLANTSTSHCPGPYGHNRSGRGRDAYPSRKLHVPCAKSVCFWEHWQIRLTVAGIEMCCRSA